MTTLEEIETFAKQKSQEIVESGQEQQPILLVLDSKGGLSISGILLSERDKEYFQSAVQDFLQKRDAIGYVFINEAYMSYKIPPKGQKVRDLPPDDREDILMITSCEKGKEVRICQAIIRNTPTGRKLDSWSEAYNNVQGRMVVDKW